MKPNKKQKLVVKPKQTKASVKKVAAPLRPAADFHPLLHYHWFLPLPSEVPVPGWSDVLPQLQEFSKRYDSLVVPGALMVEFAHRAGYNAATLARFVAARLLRPAQ
jgi:hypothetical protein